MRVGVAVAAAAVLALTAGCRETRWPSDADPAAFCDRYAVKGLPERGIDDAMVRLGTPEDLPYEARRYLLELADGEETDPVGRAAFEKYLTDHC